MPWPWKREEAPAAGAARDAGKPVTMADLESPPSSATAVERGPCRGRFRVDDVYTITGIGVVAVGEVIEGELRIPSDVRVVPGPGSPTTPYAARATSAMVRRQEIPLVLPGVQAGIGLQGVERAAVSRLTSRWNLHKGDILEAD